MTEETLRLFLAIAAIIGVITGPAGVIIAAWITIRLSKVEVKVDGMSEKLVIATAGQNKAEGQLAERDAERLYRADVPVGTDADPLSVKPVKGKI